MPAPAASSAARRRRRGGWPCWAAQAMFDEEWLGRESKRHAAGLVTSGLVTDIKGDATRTRSLPMPLGGGQVPRRQLDGRQAGRVGGRALGRLLCRVPSPWAQDEAKGQTR